MEKKRAISRRHVLAGGASIALAAAAASMLPAVQRKICGDEDPGHTAAWIDELRKNPSFERVGRAYLDHPAGRNDPVVASGMEGFFHDLASVAPSGTNADPGGGIWEVIADRIRDDFAGERVVRVGGWMLSITEARLCAVALSA